MTIYFKLWGDKLFIPQSILLVNEITDYEFRKKTKTKAWYNVEGHAPPVN